MSNATEELKQIPLSKLVSSPLNVRKKAGSNIEELAALIKSQGLLQNLVVYSEKKKGRTTGRFAVVGGGRRHRALNLLVSVNDIPADFPVNCKIVTEAEAVAASLAENSGRENMHPADVFEAYQALIDCGKTIAEIAVIYGTSDLAVKRYLKLANVAPRFIEMYRDEKANLDQLMALALTEDHAAQEATWDGLPEYNRSARAIRNLLTKQEIATDNRVARFVGLPAYEEAGGTVRRDLFSEDGAGYIQDTALLERLAVSMLEATAEAVKAEGFAWVGVRLETDHDEMRRYSRVRETRRAASAEEQTKLDELQATISSLEEERDQLDSEDARSEELDAKIDNLNGEIEGIEAAMIVLDSVEAGLAGAIVGIDWNGKVEVTRGLIKPEDKRKASATGVSDTSADEKPAHSERLTRQLTAHRTAALQIEVANNANVALVVLTHKLASSVFGLYAERSAAQISVQKPYLQKDADDLPESRAWKALEEKRAFWESKLPENNGDLFAWLLQQPQADILDLMAFCTACTLDTVQSKESERSSFPAIAKAVKLDMADYWNPTSASYFSHLPKTRIAEVVRDAVSDDVAQPLLNLKKVESAASAEVYLEGKRWIPAMLQAA